MSKRKFPAAIEDTPLDATELDLRPTYQGSAQSKLTSLPESIGGLQALTGLYVDGNRLTSLPEWIGGLQALTKLNMGANRLTSLPESIGGLQALTGLYVDGNQLTSLPESIGGLQALTTLGVGANQMTSLPESIGGLQALTVLYANANWLTSLPESIGGLQALTTLNVGSNQLTGLPESIGGLQALTKLYVAGNPLQLPPIEIASQGRTAIARYFEALKEGAVVAKVCKLILVGEGEAGKSSLLAGWLAGGEPRPVPAGPAGRTINLALESLAVDRQGVLADPAAADVIFSCWDLGGQESYAAVQQAYLVPGALYVLVVRADQTSTAAHRRSVRRFLHYLQARAPGAVVQPVLTHADTLLAAVGEASPDALATAAASQLAWLQARFDEHARTHAEQHHDAESRVPPLLRIQREHIPCVCAAAGGGASLRAALGTLVSMALPPDGSEKLLPVVGQQVRQCVACGSLRTTHTSRFRAIS